MVSRPDLGTESDRHKKIYDYVDSFVGVYKITRENEVVPLTVHLKWP